MTTLLLALAAFAVGWLLWTLGEYVLHRFAMHELHGKGIMSREHLRHHVTADWNLDYTNVLSWIGVGLVGGLLWAPLFWYLTGQVVVGLAVAAGWAFGYGFYEYCHAQAHLRGPSGRYSHWLRVHHFHHHFGHPMSNHGVSVPWWDRVFGTLERPDRIRVPRRLAMAWLVDDAGELRPEYADDYVLVGAATSDERTAALDQARAFASIAPAD
ncbi:MAG TPA: sterol desaturase family protein [Acidimicrobiales bacterium]|nr:sterol desaturase family protein [Acidimicrobiales bacterium]